MTGCVRNIGKQNSILHFHNKKTLITFVRINQDNEIIISYKNIQLKWQNRLY
jgi:hypothetical protein